MNAKKSEKRIKILNDLMDTMTSHEIFGVIKYKEKDEGYIKQYMHQPLIKTTTRLYEEHKKYKHEFARERTKETLLFEQDVNTTVPNFLFFGTYHRPDFVLEFEDGLSIAIEVKKGDRGSDIREGIGQSIVYETQYDFVLYLFIDISSDGRIKKSFANEAEQLVVKELWENHNTLFRVI